MSNSSKLPIEETSSAQVHFELLPQSASLSQSLSLPDTIKLLTEEGTKAFKLREYETAVLKYEEASQLAELHYGRSKEFADVLFNYGRALIENFIYQSSVLGDNTLEKRIALEIQEDELQSNNKSHLYFEGEPGFEDEMVEGQTEEISEVLEQELDEGESHMETANESQTGQDDDLNVANDILVIARDIYLDLNTDEAKVSLGEVHMKLGDISLEQALSASTEESQNDQAIEHVEQAMEVLNKCKKKLQDKLASVQETYGKGKQVVKSDDDSTEETEKKLNEIDQFLVEMEAKIEELNTAKINREKAVPTPSEIALAEYVKMLTPSVESSSTVTNTGPSSSTSNIPINDITSLIKRKVAANIEDNIEGSNDNLTDETNVISTNMDMDKDEEKKRKTDETTNEGGSEGRSEENKETSPNKKARLSG
ncbi:16540_t:CDS:2 [Funneliformis caledonium]|uniref:16540_t:CDS:1 n=1 Tax=Funneliformis caledonium TaxID=1117310 RepID=A0A9N9F0C8_9GLOM|nr:16540_t:CDS:2 [Funneliformis caledonium]